LYRAPPKGAAPCKALYFPLQKSLILVDMADSASLLVFFKQTKKLKENALWNC